MSIEEAIQQSDPATRSAWPFYQTKFIELITSLALDSGFNSGMSNEEIGIRVKLMSQLKSRIAALHPDKAPPKPKKPRLSSVLPQ